MSDSLSTCCYCGVVSDWEEGFVDASTFRNGPARACITCTAYRQMFPNFYFKVTIGVIFFLAIGFDATGSIPAAVAFSLIAFVAAYATIAVHELAHAAAAALVGVGVPVFSIGGGRHVYVRRMARRWLIFGLTPSEGLILITHPSRNWYRVKSAVISAAGPLMNLACAATGIIWLRRVGDTLPVYQEIAAELFVVFSLLFGVMNLFPFRIDSPYGPMSSDGRSIFEVFGMTDEQIDQAVNQTTFVVAYFEFLFGSMSEVVRMVEPLLETEDADVAIKILASAAYANTGELDKGIDLCRAELEADDLDRGQRAILLNNLSYILQFKDSSEALEEADRLSEEAYDLTPMLLSVQSTRALILAATGKEREALKFAQDKRFKIEPKVVQAEVLCTQATAYSRLGEEHRAAECLARAIRLAPDSDHIARTRARLAQV